MWLLHWSANSCVDIPIVNSIESITIAVSIDSVTAVLASIHRCVAVAVAAVGVHHTVSDGITAVGAVVLISDRLLYVANDVIHSLRYASPAVHFSSSHSWRHQCKSERAYTNNEV